MAKEKDPWSKFYWSDWLADPKLKLCSLSAQGLWIRLCCIAAEAVPIGYVVLEGNILGPKDIASECGKPLREVEAALAELLKWGVCRKDRRGRLYSRRLIKDAAKREIARKNGKNGGNPSLRKDGENPQSDNLWLKPQKPYSRARVTPKPPEGALIENLEWKGPKDVRDAITGVLGSPVAADTQLISCRWIDVPKTLVVTSPTAFGKLRACEPALRKIGVQLHLEKARAA